MQQNASLMHSGRKLRQEFTRNVAMHQHCFHCIARGGVVALRVLDHAQSDRLVEVAIDVDVANALGVAKHRNTRVRLHIINQSLRPSWDHKVH